MKGQATLRRFFGVFCIICLSVAAMPVFARAQADKKIDQGRLKIVGKGIEHLVLVGKDRKRHEFGTPGDILSLPPGRYYTEQVRLKGRFSCNTYSRTSTNSFKIDPNSTTELKIGAPLTQTITVARKGRILQLGYGLCGIGGEKYTSDSRSKPPKFAVYKGDKKIGGGKFEFG
ncbi:MAG: hypothetical protein DRP66_03065 [Planctomycetota bacterium]|nr:MAG: hypothetical protein DRP66_03065 [Planctomycetota bacterium]